MLQWLHLTWRVLLGLIPVLVLDLTTIVQADHLYKNAPELDLEALLKPSIAKHEAIVKLPAGIYRLPAKQQTVKGAQNMTIDGAGTTLLVTLADKGGLGIAFESCSKLTIKGLTIDYDPLPFTQGTITEISKDGLWVNIDLHDGYPDLNKDYDLKRIHFFDGKTREWKRAAAEGWSQDIEFETTRKIKVLFTKDFVASGKSKKLEVGDFIVFTRRSGMALRFWRSSDVRMEDVRILASHGLTVMARFMDGENYFRYKIERTGPRPEGSSQDRLLSTNADGFNYAWSRKGPTVEKCDFSYMADDAVNLHGYTSQIVRVEPPNVVWGLRRHGRDDTYGYMVREGDPVRILAADNYNIIKTVKLLSLKFGETPTNPPTREKIIEALPYMKGDKVTYFKYTLSDISGIKEGDMLDLPAAMCPGYAIRDNYFHDIRPRGIRAMAGYGIIENNRISRTTGPALNLGCHYTWFKEPGWVEDVIVKNNLLEDIGLDAEIPLASTSSPAAMSVFAEKAAHAPANTAYAMCHRNIQIIDNKIEGCSVEGIVVNGLDGGVISGNKISNCNRISTNDKLDGGRITRGYGITVMNSKDVKVDLNEFSSPSNYKPGNVYIDP